MLKNILKMVIMEEKDRKAATDSASAAKQVEDLEKQMWLAKQYQISAFRGDS